jgi:hypothetical protein
VVEVSNKDEDDEVDTIGGIIFVNEGLGTKHQSVNIKINNNTSGAIIIGMGMPDVVKNHAYKMS